MRATRTKLGTLAVLIAAGCGDDDMKVVDAAMPDMPVEEVTCDGNLEGCPEGGELKVEYVTFTDPPGVGGRTNGARFTSFLYKNAGTGKTPDAFPTMVFGKCNDITNIWPRAQADGREYIDVGQTIVYAKTDASHVVAAMPPPPAKDSVGRSHTGRASYEFTTNDVDTWIAGDHDVTIMTTGSATQKPMVFENVTHIPKNFALLDPAPGTGAIQLKEGMDRTFTYNVETSATTVPVGFLLAWVVGGEPRVVCPELQDGSFTMTAADVALLKTFGTSGTLSRQTFVHNVVDLKVGDEHRRIDAIGVWCYVTPFSIVP